MQSTPKNSSRSTIVITIIVLVAAAVYYFYYSGGASATADQSSLSIDTTSSTSQVGADVLTLLNEIHSLKIDTTFFQTPAYQSLIDFSVAIPSVPVGRPNPFSPLGSFVSTTPASSGTAPSTAGN
jgi:hypothetical protein